MPDAAEMPFGGELNAVLQGRPPRVRPIDHEADAARPGRLKHPLTIGAIRRERLLDQHVESPGGGGAGQIGFGAVVREDESAWRESSSRIAS